MTTLEKPPQPILQPDPSGGGKSPKTDPLLKRTGTLVMIGLGLLMVTYNFHRFTGWIFELWS